MLFNQFGVKLRNIALLLHTFQKASPSTVSGLRMSFGSKVCAAMRCAVLWVGLDWVFGGSVGNGLLTRWDFVPPPSPLREPSSSSCVWHSVPLSSPLEVCRDGVHETWQPSTRLLIRRTSMSVFINVLTCSQGRGPSDHPYNPNQCISIHALLQTQRHNSASTKLAPIESACGGGRTEKPHCPRVVTHQQHIASFSLSYRNHETAA